jgi:phospholipid-binding lipoprotein MlaA
MTASPLGGAGAPSSEASGEGELYDPFAKSDGPVADEYDPWEPFNSTMFEFNRKVDRFVLKPVAQGYDFIVPDVA